MEQAEVCVCVRKRVCVCVRERVCVCVSRRKTETIVTVGARLMVKHMALLQLSLYITVYPLAHTPNLAERTITGVTRLRLPPLL